MLFLKKNIRTQKKCEINNYFLNWISALVKEMGGNFSLNFEFDFSVVFWGDLVKNMYAINSDLKTSKKCKF